MNEGRAVGLSQVLVAGGLDMSGCYASNSSRTKKTVVQISVSTKSEAAQQSVLESRSLGLWRMLRQ